MFKEVSRARHTETLSAEVRDTVNLPKVMTSAQEKGRSAGKEPAQEGGVPASSAEAVEVPGHKTLETHAVASSVGGLVPTVNTHQLSVLGPDQNIHSPAHSVETQPLAVQPLQNVQSEIIHIEDTHSETVFTPRPGRTQAAIILGPGEAGDCTSHLPSDGLFLACQERASQLEVWLEEAQLSLTGPVLPNRNRTMQDSVEKQLQCCQEMFLDLEQKVSSHSSLGHDEEEKIALITKLQVLKNNLVTVQLLLQERYSEEQVCVGRDHPLQAQLQHSTSVQQILTSKGKIFRQSSLQQQRELEQGLSEQKDLTKAIVEQGTRALLHSQSKEERNSVSPPVSEDELRQEEEESAQRKWAHLHRRLTQRAGEQQGDEDKVSEQAPGQQQGDEDKVSEQAPGQQQGDEDEVSEQAPGQISTPSVCVWNYDDGAVCLQELQSHSIHLKKLVHAASSAPDMQTVDEDLFELLSGIERSLSSLLHTLLSDTGTIHADAHHQLLQLQSLSAELTSLGAELTSQGSELMRSLGSGSGTRGASACLGLAQARVSMVQNILSGRQHQLQKQMDHMLEKQRKIKNLHASLLANTSAPEVRQCDLPTQLQAVARLRQELREKEQELADLKEDAGSEGQAPGLTLEITTLESMLDRLWCGVRERCAVLHYGQEQQCHGERLLQGLRNLVELARDRLTSATQLQLHSPEELHTYLTSHTKFFLSLGTRLQSLQQLSSRTPDSALCGREAAVADLEEQVESLQRQAQEAGTALQAILRLWSEWEESQSWLEKLLQDLEIQLPKMHLGEQMDEALQESLSTYETLQMILEQNRVQICLTLDQPRRLQREPMSEHGAGVSYDVEGIVVRRAGVSSLRLKQRLAALRRKVEHGRDSARQMKKLWSRYRRDHAALNKWMSKTRECLHTWIGHMTSPNQEAHQALSHYKEFIKLSKELEATSVLKASVISAGTEILALSERVHQDGPSQPTGTTARSALETTIAVRQPAGEDAPDKDVCSVKNNITVDTVSAVDPVLVEDVSTNGDSRSQAHASAERLAVPFSNEGTTTIQDECPEDGLPTKDISGSVRPQAVDTCGGSSTSREVMVGDGCGPGQSAPAWMAALSPALLTLQSHLAQTEQRWAETYALVPTTQLCLHQRMVERMCPQGLLAQVGSWISTAEARLQEAAWELPPCATAPRLQKLLSTYKVLKREMSCEQMSLGFLTQSVLKHSELDCPSHRHRHTAFAEQLGMLNLRWEALSAELNTQVCHVEQLLGICTDRDGKLRLLRDWVMRHSAWMRLAERPVSLSLAEHSLRDCEELEAKLNAKSAELSDLRKRKLSADEEHRDTDFIRQTRRVSLSLSDLAQQNHALKKTLQQVCKAWSQFDSGRRKAGLNTLRLSQSLEYCHTTQTPLAAFQKGTDRLQALRDEAEQIDRQWEELSDTLATLTDGINTGTSQLLSEELEKDRARWSEVKQNLTHTSRQFHTLLQVWRRYSALAGSCSQRLEQYREQLSTLAKTTAEPQSSTEKLTASVRHVCELLTGMDSLQNDLDQVLQTSKELIGQMEPTVAVFIQLECRLLTRGCLQLEEAFKEKLWTMQEELKQFEEFEQLLESLETHLEEWQSNQRTHTDTDISESGLLELSSYSADLELLNELSYRLALGEPTTQKLQSLNRKWVHASALAQERCSELQAVSLQQKSFEERCKTWTVFLQRMEDSLVVEISSTYPGLREQLRTHQRFQAELPLGHQILHSVITGALHLLNRGEVEDRSDFLLKLAQLRERWQEVVWRAAQGRSLVVGLTQHWRLYTRTLHKLQRLLTLAHALVPPAGLTHRSVPQLRRLWDDMERAEMLFQRSLSSYLLILEVGKQLFSASGEEVQMQLQTDLATLQDEWESTRCMLGKRRTLTADVIQNWDRCMLKLADHAQRLEEVRVRLKQPIQDTKEERGLVKEIQDSLENWVASLSELNTMKTDLSQYIITDDILLLQEQVDHLHCQWEELCLKVSLRKQEIADHLNAWIIFNEKNKELCEWLTQMENEVAHSAELSIEDMVEKLKKDCMEEINLFSENKTHLKQLGEQLITASNKTKEAEINDKLKDINDRWLHLFDHIEARVKKLKGTLVMVQQLDKNMSNLRTWLSRIEGELAKPIVYRVCHGDEIQRKLAEQQELQRDIEQHTEGVASVLTLCDVLLHDTDACGSDAENDSIQQTTHSLDRRWRNICAMSMERRMRIEETWRLWSKFMEDYSRFEEWLSAAERTAANPASADVLYTCAKEELKKFEAFQRQVHERLTQLELVNKQYRRLARENRTDTASKLKMMVNEGNQRWDTLQRRVTAVLRRLKHFTSQRDDFEGSREAILMWLTEMDLQLTNVEHFSESDIRDKMRQLDAFRQEITLNTDKIDALIVFGENLIQKSCPVDAVLIEEELEEMHSYCQEVFGRVDRFHRRLVLRRPVLDEEYDFSDRDADVEDSLELETEWARGGEPKGEIPEACSSSSTQRAECHGLLPPPLQPSGRDTPGSVDSIPLEWDHTVDVGGSSSPEDEEEVTYYSALSDIEVAESSEACVNATARALSARPVGRAMTEPPGWHSPAPKDRERIIHSLTSSPTHVSTSYHPHGYAKLMSECNESIDNVKRVKLILNDGEVLEDQGLTTLSAADQHTSVIERWELLGARQACVDGDVLRWGAQSQHGMGAELDEVTVWLDSVLPELDRLRRTDASGSIRDMETSVRELKEMQRTFSSYKALMIGVNLSGRDLQHGDNAELDELREGLRAANQKWMCACASLDSWEGQLQRALLECQEFHETLHSLLLWLARAESQRYMVNIHDHNVDTSLLQEHRNTLRVVYEELQCQELEVRPLQEISSHILQLDQGDDSLEAKEKVHVIGNKLRLLLRQVTQDLSTLQARLDSEGSDGWGPAGLSALSDEEAKAVERRPGSAKRKTSPTRPLLYRVLRAALPIHVLLLLVLALACLVPPSEDDYSCALSNTFARSFYPMLRYTNGPPPT